MNHWENSLIHERTTKAQIWSAPLFFTVARFVFFFFEGEASHKLKWKAKWYSGMYKFLVESVITGLFSPLIVIFALYNYLVGDHLNCLGMYTGSPMSTHKICSGAKISIIIWPIIQISLYISAGWSQLFFFFLFCLQTLYLLFLQANNEEHDQRLIWGVTVCKFHKQRTC